MIKTISIFLSLGVLLSILAFYFIVNSSPIPEETLQTIIQEEQIGEDEEIVLWNHLEEKAKEGLIFEYLANEVYIVFGLIAGALFFYLSSIHLVVDKLGFKKYYESANTFAAIRRSSLIIAALILFMYLYLLRTEPYIYVTAPLLLFVLEISYSLMTQRKSKPELMEEQLKR